MVDLPAPLPPPIQRMCRSRCGDRSNSREGRVILYIAHKSFVEGTQFTTLNPSIPDVERFSHATPHQYSLFTSFTTSEGVLWYSIVHV